MSNLETCIDEIRNNPSLEVAAHFFKMAVIGVVRQHYDARLREIEDAIDELEADMADVQSVPEYASEWIDSHCHYEIKSEGIELTAKAIQVEDVPHWLDEIRSSYASVKITHLAVMANQMTSKTLKLGSKTRVVPVSKAGNAYEEFDSLADIVDDDATTPDALAIDHDLLVEEAESEMEEGIRTYIQACANGGVGRTTTRYYATKHFETFLDYYLNNSDGGIIWLEDSKDD